MRYDPWVRAIFNPKRYSKEVVTLDWMETDFFLTCTKAYPGKPCFLALDVFAGQKTPAVLTAFRSSNTVTSFIPEGCTGLVQPLDTAVNKTLKSKISELLDEEHDKNPIWTTGQFRLGDRRILMTWVIGEAWDWLHREKKELIVSSFWHVGISLVVDGSQDYELKIKGLEDLVIGDWREGGLDCNLNRLGKTGIGELQWDIAAGGLEGMELLDLQVALDVEKELLRLDNLEEGEYIDIDELALSGE